MKVLDEHNLLRQIADLAIREPEREHCVLAMAVQIDADTYKLSESCYAEELGGFGERFHFYIPIKASMEFLDICRRKQSIPVIIHTHPYRGAELPGVRFSQGDISYMDCFTEVAAEEGFPCCLFIVTDGASLMYCRRTLPDMRYTFEEGKVRDMI